MKVSLRPVWQVCIVMLLSLTGINATLHAQPQEITLGVIAGITGLGATYGEGIVQGAKMAVADINAAGGINGHLLRLKIVDDATSPPHSAIAMRHLTTSNISLIVGGWGSPQVLANMAIAEQAGVPYIVVGATSPRITSTSNRWTFRVIPSDAILASQLAHIAADVLNYKRIALIYDNNDYGVGNREVFVETLRQAGVEPVEIESFNGADKDFSQQLTRIAETQPEALAVFATVPAAPAIMNQAREMGIKARFLGTGGLANERLLAVAPEAAEGALLVVSFFSNETDPEAGAWIMNYRQQFNGEANIPDPILAAWEYRAITDIAAPCLERADKDRVKLRECIAHWHGQLLGIQHEAYFDDSGQLIYPPEIVEVRNAEVQLWKSQ